jgi:GR25 family glycosyltransferase involved in LPS biosynthesis
MKSIKDITNAFYINLEEREDRKKKTKKEFKQLKIKIQRMKAIKLENGRIGCSMSHLKCLQHAKEKDLEHVLIVEDDIHFMNVKMFKEQLNKFLSSSIEWDVVLFAGNNLPPYQIYGDFCVKVTRCQTTTGYLVKKHYYDILISNIKESIQLLLKEPERHIDYAIDKYWIRLQEKGNWFIITPLSVVQREDYSDIEKRETNYSTLMLDINKSFLYNKYVSKENVL